MKFIEKGFIIIYDQYYYYQKYLFKIEFARTNLSFIPIIKSLGIINGSLINTFLLLIKISLKINILNKKIFCLD